MRHSIKRFVKICSDVLPIIEPIYEFGAMQVAGQEGVADLRPYFNGKEYVGADISEGLGVDVILNLHDIDLPSESVGTIIACDTLEHVEYPRLAINEIRRILKPQGVLIMSSVMDWPIHGYPHDYWRFTPEGFRSLLSCFPSVYVDWNGNNDKPHTVVGVTLKTEYDFAMLQSKRSDWRSVNDFPLGPKLLSPVVKSKKWVERMWRGK